MCNCYLQSLKTKGKPNYKYSKAEKFSVYQSLFENSFSAIIIQLVVNTMHQEHAPKIYQFCVVLHHQGVSLSLSQIQSHFCDVTTLLKNCNGHNINDYSLIA